MSCSRCKQTIRYIDGETVVKYCYHCGEKIPYIDMLNNGYLIMLGKIRLRWYSAMPDDPKTAEDYWKIRKYFLDIICNNDTKICYNHSLCRFFIFDQFISEPDIAKHYHKIDFTGRDDLKLFSIDWLYDAYNITRCIENIDMYEKRYGIPMENNTYIIGIDRIGFIERYLSGLVDYPIKDREAYRGALKLLVDILEKS